MDFEKKDSSTYLDGVPFRISPKFYPPRNVQIPFACAPLFPLDLLEEEYDFSLEKEVLESHRKQVAEEETVPKVIDDDDGSSEVSPEDKEYSTNRNGNPGPSNFSASSWQSSSILQPQSQAQFKTVENGPYSASRNSSKNINLSDFENDTSSPFDIMELKTINDLEELSSVFQDLGGSKQKALTDNDKSAVYASYNTSLPSLNSNSETKEQTLTNFSKSVSFPLNQESRFLNSDNCHSSASTASCDPTSTVDVDCRNVNGSNHVFGSFQDAASLPRLYHGLDARGVENTVVFTEKENVRFSSLKQVPPSATVSLGVSPETKFMDSVVPQSVSFNPSKGSVTLRSSKSFSDLHSLPLHEDSGILYTSGRSHTPPSVVASPFLDSENCLREDVPNRNDNGSNSSLPDPYSELEEAEQLFVDSVTDMGFPRGQVARTVKHLGTDEKKVVEHLCQIQTLEEFGYDSLEAEAALHLHDYNTEEARKFLDLLIKIQGLGFEKTAIKKALVQNKNDMNKAINSLLP